MVASLPRGGTDIPCVKVKTRPSLILTWYAVSLPLGVQATRVTVAPRAVSADTTS
jgi:hypothetical protein